MAEGGEERAAFVALKNDAQSAIPKIAEKDAEFVDSTVQKGAKSLANHAANEADVTADLNSNMPKDPVPIHANPTQAADTTVADGGAAAEADSAQSAVAGEEPVKGTPVSEALNPDDGKAADPDATPQFDNNALSKGKNFNQQIDDELNARGLDRAEHDQLRTSKTNDLSDDQIQQVVDVRNSIKIGDGQIITKVLKPNIADGYLKNADHIMDNGELKDFRPGGFGGSIARGSDTADLKTPDQLRDALALDDKGAKPSWSPVPHGTAEAYQLRLAAPKDLHAETTFGAVGDKAAADHVGQLAGQSAGRAWNEPFTGTGYTGGGVPEWDASGMNFTGRAEIWRMGADGRESMAGYFDPTEKSWVDLRG
jgi:hypothetical protein